MKVNRTYLGALFALLATSGLMAAPGGWIPKPTTPTTTPTRPTTSQPATAQARPVFQFNGIPWGSTREQVNAAMAKADYVQNMQFKSVYGDDGFAGRLLAERCVIICCYNPDGKLVKILVSLLTKDLGAIAKYHEAQELLTLRYGPPVGSLELYDPPFKKGDGYAETAIRAGKATIGTLWGSTDDDSVGLSIGKDMSVSLHYEPAAWSAEADRRKKLEAQKL